MEKNNTNINLSKEIINKIEINSSVGKNDNLNLQQKVEQQENEQKKEQQKSKEENVTNQIALNKAYEKISENKNIEKNNNLNIQQDVTNKNEITSTSDAEYLKIQLKNLITTMGMIKKFRYEELKKRTEELEKKFKEFDISKNANTSFFLSKIVNIINLKEEINKNFNYAAEIIKKQENVNSYSAKNAKDAMEKSKKSINEIQDKLLKLCDELEQSIEELENNSTSHAEDLKKELKNLMKPIFTLKIKKYKDLEKRSEKLEKKIEELNTSKDEDASFFVSIISSIMNLENKINKNFSLAAKIFEKQKNMNENSAKEAKKAMNDSKKLMNAIEDEIKKLCDELEQSIKELENNSTNSTKKVEVDLKSLTELSRHFLEEIDRSNEELINLTKIVQNTMKYYYNNLEKRSGELEKKVEKLDMFDEKNKELIIKCACIKSLKNKIEEIHENGLNLIDTQKCIIAASVVEILNSNKYIKEPVVYLKKIFENKKLIKKGKETLEEAEKTINKEKDAIADLCVTLKKYIEILEKKF